MKESKRLSKIIDNTESLRNKDVPQWLGDFAQVQVENRNPSELRILQSLQKNSIYYGFSFVYQQPLVLEDNLNCILDFVIYFKNQKPIVLEIDGFQHLKKDYKLKDENRDRLLEENGYIVERVYSAKINNKRDANAVILQLLYKYRQTNYFILNY